MPGSYPYELRIRVIEFIESGHSVLEANRIFKVCRETIYQWLKIKEDTGDVKAKEGYQKGSCYKVKDIERLKNFIENNKDKTLKELGEEWPEGKMHETTMLRWLRRIGYSHKKKLFIHQKDLRKGDKFLLKK